MAMLELKSPIASLHRDALSLVFTAACDAPFKRDQKSSLTVPLTLSHVCRHWRAVVMTQPRLWTEFFWKPGDSGDAALAVLERSRAAPLRMNISLGQTSNASETDDTVNPAMLADEHDVLEAAAAHFHRVAHLRLSFSLDSLESAALGELFQPGGPGCSMPWLRVIDVALTDTGHVPQDMVPRLNIASPPLVSISLGGVQMADAHRLVGPETTHLDLNCLNLPLAELHSMLDRTPNLKLLHLFFYRVFHDSQDPLPEAPRVSATLDSINILSPQRETLMLLRALIPSEALARVREVGVLLFRAETPRDAMMGFLRVDELALAGIVSLEVSCYMLQFKTAGGTERNLSGDMPSLDFLSELFTPTSESPSGAGIVSALREIAVSLDLWADLMRLFEAAGGSLPELEAVRLSISQDDFLSHGGAESDFYHGARIAAPRLESIEVTLYGRAPPTLPLVQRYIHALWSFPPPQNGTGEMEVMYYDRSLDENLLDLFFDIYEAEMELLGRAAARQ